MKKRITSFVLAVLMVVSMALVFSVSAFAETPVYTITVGNAYGVPGGTATVELFVSANQMIEGQDWLRDIQIAFSGLQVKDTGYTVFKNGDKATKDFVNLSRNVFGVTTEPSNATDQYNLGTIEQMTAYGGRKFAALQFEIPDSAVVGSVIDLSISDIEAYRMEKYDPTDPAADNVGLVTVDVNTSGMVATVAGKVQIVDGSAADADALKAAIAGGVGTRKNVSIPQYFGDTVVTGVTNGLTGTSLESYLSGLYGTLVVPATVTDLGDAIGFMYIDETDEDAVNALGFALKNTEADGIVATIADLAAMESFGVEDDSVVGNVVDVYYHKQPNVAKSSYEAEYEALSENAYSQKIGKNLFYFGGKDSIALHNILDVYTGDGTVTYPGYFVDGQKVTLLAGITCDDTNYEELSFSVTFTEGSKYKTFTKVVKGVYKTVAGIASTDQGTAESVGAYAEGFEYLTALSISGVPTGHTYTVTVQLNGLTEDAAGALIGVCSDVATFTITL